MSFLNCPIFNPSYVGPRRPAQTFLCVPQFGEFITDHQFLGPCGIERILRFSSGRFVSVERDVHQLWAQFAVLAQLPLASDVNSLAVGEHLADHRAQQRPQFRCRLLQPALQQVSGEHHLERRRSDILRILKPQPSPIGREPADRLPIVFQELPPVLFGPGHRQPLNQRMPCRGKAQ